MSTNSRTGFQPVGFVHFTLPKSYDDAVLSSQ
jgi:hypothetical protein